MNSIPLRTIRRSLFLLVLTGVFWTAVTGLRAAPLTAAKIAIDPTKIITRENLFGDRRFALKGWKGDLSQTRITDLAGNDIASYLAPKLEGGVVTLAQPTRPFIIKSKTPPLVTLADHADTVLPGGLVVAPSSGANGSGVSAVWFRLVCSLSPRPAPWNEGETEYVTQMKFAVNATAGSPPSVTLPAPVTVSLEFDGMVAKDVPDFTITQAGLEHQKTVELRFRPSTSQPKLKVRSTISDSDVAIEALPHLELRPDRTEFLGFGLETLPITVAQVNPDGEPSTVTVPTAVDVQVQGSARREGSDVVIPAGVARAEFRLRSAGLGKVTARATVGALAAATEVTAKFPLGPLIAALLGGAVGGWSRRWLKGARKRAALRHVVEGVVVGAVAFVAGVLGVGYLNLPAAVVATEAGAFLSAVLCGFVGVTVLTAITERMKGGGE
ncbi:MAG TPA: hypothetical protein VGM64_21350 [Lacunisphaera sp.]|jgi:hypothetical protein